MTIRRVLLVTALALAALVSASVGVGWQLTRPVPSAVGAPPPQLGARDVSFPSDSGSTIQGWLVTPATPRGVVLLLPPVRSNRLAMVRRAAWLRDAGYASLLIDFQATGESRGSAITFGWRERFDVLAARRFVSEQLPRVPVAVIGSSLGGAAALLASPALETKAMVLEAVYPAIDVAVENRLRMRLGPAARPLTPLLLMQLPWRLGTSVDQLRPADRIAHVRCPVLVIGGTEDRHTTEADTRRLHAAAREPKELWLIPGAGHVDYFDAVGPTYRARVLEFLGTALGVRFALRNSDAAPTRPRQP